ncbi:hypothetical protein BR93DRAFT_798422 [Coniochaeta sp. PMI_546]|nr:hypothetical protein BR93DRAFT_798422 [Coniochaeta sp. PMI_546]
MGHPAPRSPGAEGPKRRACDECRSRKLACTKEADGCSRCKRDGVRCHYSQQKQMGRPRKVKRPQETVHVEEVPESRHPVIMPASDSAMDLDLDLDLAFFDMNDVSFLDLMGSDYLVTNNTPAQTAAPPPKQPARQTRSPGVWQMMTAGHLAHDINFDNHTEAQALSEEFSLEEAAEIMAAEIPEITSLPALSPPQQSSASSEHPSPSTHQPNICSCLASLYLALDSLQHLPKDACSAIRVARSASKSAYNAISCPVCSTPPLDPTETSSHPPIQSLQNMMMLGALLPSLSNAYKTILRMVDEEAHAANLASRRITFDLSAYGGLWGSLGTDNMCGAADNINGRELEPAMWRLIVRALLKIDVYGLSDCTPAWEGPGPDRTGAGAAAAASAPLWQPGLKDIIQMMEERSRSRHEQIDALVAAGALRIDGRCEYVPLENGTGDKPTCFRIIDIAKKSMQSLVIP